MLFLGLLDFSLNRLAAILCLHLSGAVQGQVYGAESVFLIFNSFFLNRKVCFSSFFYIPRDMQENKAIECSFKLITVLIGSEKQFENTAYLNLGK